MVFRKLGWEPVSGERHLNTMLRKEVLMALATFGHSETHKEAMRRFQAFLDDRNSPLLSADTKRVKFDFHAQIFPSFLWDF